mmetsp:Transcript_135151/g.341933  ORF Transcript_135151/g.341933 Transcript_135151/m.341933 type:complete len:207 (-) Transcript_135151:230-850(-)
MPAHAPSLGQQPLRPRCHLPARRWGRLPAASHLWQKPPPWRNGGASPRPLPAPLGHAPGRRVSPQWFFRPPLPRHPPPPPPPPRPLLLRPPSGQRRHEHVAFPAAVVSTALALSHRAAKLGRRPAWPDCLCQGQPRCCLAAAAAAASAAAAGRAAVLPRQGRSTRCPPRRCCSTVVAALHGLRQKAVLQRPLMQPPRHYLHAIPRW